MSAKEMANNQKNIEVQIAEIATEVRFLAKSIAENNLYTKEMVASIKKLVDDHEGRIREMEVRHQEQAIELNQHKVDTTKLLWLVSSLVSLVSGVVVWCINKFVP